MTKATKGGHGERGEGEKRRQEKGGRDRETETDRQTDRDRREIKVQMMHLKLFYQREKTISAASQHASEKQI